MSVGSDQTIAYVRVALAAEVLLAGQKERREVGGVRAVTIQARALGGRQVDHSAFFRAR